MKLIFFMILNSNCSKIWLDIATLLYVENFIDANKITFPDGNMFFF